MAKSMTHLHKLMLAFAILPLFACGATRGKLAAKFGEEYKCDGAHISLLRFDESTMIAKGCGQSAQYEKSCPKGQSCDWVKKAK